MCIQEKFDKLSSRYSEQPMFLKIYRCLVVNEFSHIFDPSKFFKIYPEMEKISEILNWRVFEIGKALNRIFDQIYFDGIQDLTLLNIQKIDCNTMPYIPNHSRLNDPYVLSQNASASYLCRFKSLAEDVFKNDDQKARLFWKAIEYLFER